MGLSTDPLGYLFTLLQFRRAWFDSCNGLMAHRLSRENQHHLGYIWTPMDRKDRQHINAFACASLNAQIHLCTYLYVNIYIYLCESPLPNLCAHILPIHCLFVPEKNCESWPTSYPYNSPHIPTPQACDDIPSLHSAMLGDRTDATGVEAIFRLSGPQGRCSVRPLRYVNMIQYEPSVYHDLPMSVTNPMHINLSRCI